MTNKQSSSTTSPETSTETLRIIKVATCPSLSLKSELTYHIACDSDNEIYFRIAENSGNGFFSIEWIALSDIEKVFDNVPASTGIVAFTLEPLFKGKSVNTPAFLLAALKAEGLVRPVPNRRRTHERLPSDDFIAAMYALVDAEVDIDASKRKTVKQTTKKPSKSSKAA